MAFSILTKYWDQEENRLCSIRIGFHDLTSLYESNDGEIFIRSRGGDVRMDFVPQLSGDQMKRYSKKEKMFFIEGLERDLLEKGESFNLFFAHGDSISKLRFDSYGFHHGWTNRPNERREIEKVWRQNRMLMARCFGSDYNLSEITGSVLGSWNVS